MLYGQKNFIIYEFNDDDDDDNDNDDDGDGERKTETVNIFLLAIIKLWFERRMADRITFFPSRCLLTRPTILSMGHRFFRVCMSKSMWLVASAALYQACNE